MREERLTAIHEGRVVGTVFYKRDQLRFDYEPAWQRAGDAFPLSLSMPLAATSHGDDKVRPFLSGLLPDNAQVLEAWGKRFHVSARNPFRLLSHVGEECAGAVQFVPEARAVQLLAHPKSGSVQWLDDQELADRLKELVTNHADSRRMADEGQFSLAGAQAKSALIHDETEKRWGIPSGTTPTTHIFKPNVGTFPDYDLNEYYCQQLAAELGLPAARVQIESFGDIKVLISERYDRIRQPGGRIRRIHQEDACQALSHPPENKYQNQGGPDAKSIFGLIRAHSTKVAQDEKVFLRALIFNFMISGTDAHAKNYSFLIGAGGQVRLAPLYDLSSIRPYPKQIHYEKAKLAMNIGGEYRLTKITNDHWRKAAREWKLNEAEVLEELQAMRQSVESASSEVLEKVPALAKSPYCNVI